MTPLRRARGTALVVRTAVGQRRIPFLPWAEIEELRDRRVRELARYAAETVPHYRELWAAEGIDPASLRTAADLERLPLLEKETVRRDPDRFVSESPLGRDSVPFLTSGSTGLRLRIHHDRRSLLLNTAFRERQRQVVVAFTGKELRALKVSLQRPGGTGRKVRTLLDRSTVLLRQRKVVVSTAQPLDAVVREINELRPEIVRGAGSFLELLYRTLAATGTPMHRPRIVAYGDDVMTREGRELIERRFGVPVISSYNAVEVFQLAFTCELRRGFHPYHDLTHVAVLPEGADRPVREGRGAVVVSNLVNHGTVLLNYRLGDVATLSWERCPCGRTGPVLSDIEGRLEDRLRLPDGSTLSSRLVWDVVKVHDEVIRYQFVQHELQRFELRLATEGREQYERVSPAIVAGLRELVDGSIDVRFDPSLAGPVERKFRAVVSHVPPPASSAAV